MDRPKGTSARDWAQARADLAAVSETWDDAARAALTVRFTEHAATGMPLPAAFITALTDLLGAAADE